MGGPVFWLKDDEARESPNDAAVADRTAKIALGISILSPLVVLLTCAATLAFQWFAAQPSLRGRVVSLIVGQTTRPSPDGHLRSTFTTLLIIANARDIPVPVIDYGLRLTLRDGTRVDLDPAYDYAAHLSL